MKVWNITAVISLKDHPEQLYSISKQYRAENDAEANGMFFSDIDNESFAELAQIEAVEMIQAIDGESPSELIH